MDELNDKWFQVSVKGMFFNPEGKLMMIQEKSGIWELPGGRIEKGEEMLECLVRECNEELGLEAEILEKQPSFVYSTLDHTGKPRIMVFYRILLKSLDFKPNDECLAINFFSKEEISSINYYPPLKKLLDLI